MAQGFNAVAGGICSEAKAGTNCIGTGVIVAKPINIMPHEHYLPVFREWNTCSAPILPASHAARLSDVTSHDGEMAE